MGAVFGDRHHVWRAVDGATGREHHPAHADLVQRAQKVVTAADVVVEVLPRVLHGFTRRLVAGEVHHRIDGILLDHFGDLVTIGNVDHDERRVAE